MENCKLCLVNKADKSGSHIVPHFLMKRIDNEYGTKERDRDLGFTIRDIETTSHFGRSVQPEKLREIYGELSEEEKGNYKSPYVVDNFFCSACESKFSQIENEYSKSLKVKTADSNIKPQIGLLFWISVLWRISILKNLSLILKTNEEELLRKILNRHLNPKYRNIDLNIIKNDVDCLKLAYRLIRCPDFSNEKNKTVLFCSPYHKMPYSLLIDEYVLFFYFKKGQIDNLIQDFFGFEKDLKGKFINTVNTGETKILYEREVFKNCIDIVTKLFSENMREKNNLIIDDAYKVLGGQGNTISIEKKQNILERFNSNPLGRLKLIDKIKIVYEEMFKCEPQSYKID